MATLASTFAQVGSGFDVDQLHVGRWVGVRRWSAFRNEILQQPNGREVLFNGCPPLQADWVSQQVPPLPTRLSSCGSSVRSACIARCNASVALDSAAWSRHCFVLYL